MLNKLNVATTGRCNDGMVSLWVCSSIVVCFVVSVHVFGKHNFKSRMFSAGVTGVMPSTWSRVCSVCSCVRMLLGVDRKVGCWCCIWLWLLRGYLDAWRINCLLQHHRSSISSQRQAWSAALAPAAAAAMHAWRESAACAGARVRERKREGLPSSEDPSEWMNKWAAETP